MLLLSPRRRRRCCRPNMDTFVGVLLFGLFGLVVTILWTLEPMSPSAMEAMEADRRRQELLEQFVHEREALQKEMREWERRMGRTVGTPAAVVVVAAAAPERREDADGSRKINSVMEPGNRIKLDADGEDEEDEVTKNISTTMRRRNRIRTVRPRFELDRTTKPEVDEDADTWLRGAPGVAGKRRWCSVYNTTPPIDDPFECIRLRLKPPTTVCLHDDASDVHVSRHLRGDGMWEPHIVRIFQNLLYQNPQLGVIDVGSHVGQYALLAASMGRRVVAVEPFLPSVRRVHKAIKIGRLEDKVVLVHNGISDRRGVFEMYVPEDNQGGAAVRHDHPEATSGTTSNSSMTTTTILMDDLLEVVDFRFAVMKIDIEGHEHRALAHADRLFDAVSIPYIFMEWMKLRAEYGAEVDDSVDKRLVQRLVDWLTGRRYSAYSLVLLQRLSPEHWYGWPDDIFWQHADADPFF